MVLDVFVRGCKISFSCQYSGFSKFRGEILRGWNEELGQLYQQQFNSLHDIIIRSFNIDNENLLLRNHFVLNRRKEIESRIEKILNEYDKPYNEGMKIFAYHSDCDGEITPSQCELLLKAFEHVDVDKFDDSNEEMNEWYRESYENWIQMMIYAIENNKSILFS